jgi:hypothetical protein
MTWRRENSWTYRDSNSDLSVIIIITITIIIINIIGKAATFYPVIISSDFATVILVQSKIVSLDSNPNLEDQVSVFISPSERVAHL